MAVLREYRNEDTYFPEGTFCVFPKVGQEPLVIRKLFENRTVSIGETHALIYDDYEFRFIPITIQGYVDFDAIALGFSSFEEVKARVERRKYLLNLRKQRHIAFEQAKKYNLSRSDFIKLHRLSNRFAEQELKIIFNLLKTKEFKSEFRKKCNLKIRSWIKNAQEHYPLTQSEFYRLGSLAIAKNMRRLDY